MGFADSLSGMWSVLHEKTPLTFREREVHYLRRLAFSADDDMVSNLLIEKLRLARIANAAAATDSLVFMNSFLEYRFDGGEPLFCQLVHPSPGLPKFGVSVVSLIGAGLIGMEAGQTILWPDAAGTLCDLEVVHVENNPGLNDWLGFTPQRGETDV